MRLMWGIRGWCGRGGSGKRCDGACVCEREGMNSVVNTVIVWIGNVAGVWVELGKANGGKCAVVVSVKGYKVDTCGVRGKERKTAGESACACACAYAYRRGCEPVFSLSDIREIVDKILANICSNHRPLRFKNRVDCGCFLLSRAIKKD